MCSQIPACLDLIAILYYLFYLVTYCSYYMLKVIKFDLLCMTSVHEQHSRVIIRSFSACTNPPSLDYRYNVLQNTPPSTQNINVISSLANTLCPKYFDQCLLSYYDTGSTQGVRLETCFVLQKTHFNGIRNQIPKRTGKIHMA